ncbi:MAG: tRNA pseudouridine(55) synthase TruB [Prolixibacteraceae bacterium]|nr:tRNA pseudouridine(55) synthase TruB [Prolixibacteraceae bacterium]
MTQKLNDIDFISGAVIPFNKPLDWTSFDVVNKIRWNICKKLKIKKLKVGHAGTLDPKATGLVIVCTGKATKMIENLQAEEKEYIATLKLGATTPSFDLETNEDNHYPTKHLNQSLIEETLLNFIGEIDQVPPVFSAIKVEGKRAFDYARKGKDLNLVARKVFIKMIQVISYTNNELVIKVECGKGTYIRSLARDIGKALNTGAYLTALERTRIGNCTLEDAWEIENFEKKLALL